MRMFGGWKEAAYGGVCTAPLQSYITTTWFPCILLAISPLVHRRGPGMHMHTRVTLGIARAYAPLVSLGERTRVWISLSRRTYASLAFPSLSTCHSEDRKDRFYCFRCFNRLLSVLYSLKFVGCVEINSNRYIYWCDKLCVAITKVSNVSLDLLDSIY